MKLQEIFTADIKLGYEAVADDKDLSAQIQTRLVALNLLEPPADGNFGPISAHALQEFQLLTKCDETEFIGKITAKKLIEFKREQLPKPEVTFGNDLAGRICQYMQAKGYQIFTGQKEYNIVYVEGMNSDGTLNNDDPNEFNDLRMVIEFVNNMPKIVNCWEATTEPGSYYTYHPMNPKGAARIQFGQYKSWRIGMHGHANPHEALVQVAPITVHRDFNKDFKRTGDALETGVFAVNQHWGYDLPKNNVGNASAGCLVGRTRAGHKEFMQLIKQDRRYVADHQYIFTATVIDGSDLVKMFPS